MKNLNRHTRIPFFQLIAIWRSFCKNRSIRILVLPPENIIGLLYGRNLELFPIVKAQIDQMSGTKNLCGMLVKLPEIAVYRNAAGIRGSRDHICFADRYRCILTGPKAIPQVLIAHLLKFLAVQEKADLQLRRSCFADGKAVISSGNGALIIPFPFDGAVIRILS